MKTQKIILFLVISVIGTTFSLAQGFVPPAEGKAVVYFTRVSSYGFAISFEYFHNDKYIGVFKGKNYMRYECDPGQQLLWASSENKEFLTADLKEGGVYVVMVDIAMGFGKARVALRPITAANGEDFLRAKELILSKSPIVTPQPKVEQMNSKLKDFITEKLKMYEEVWKREKDFKHISAEMALTEEDMK
jgi:hypothetical protein